MDKISEDVIVPKKQKPLIKRPVWPLNVIDLRAFSKKKKNDDKQALSWESEGGHL